jgi:hypothetical protein
MEHVIMMMGSCDKAGARRGRARPAAIARSDLLKDTVPFMIGAVALAMLAQVFAANPALAEDPAGATEPAATAETLHPDAYLLARLRAGQSWDSGTLSIGELRPGSVDRAQLKTYMETAGKPTGSGIDATAQTFAVIAALGPNMPADQAELVMNTASALMGEPGIIPRSHLGADGAWEFPRLPNQDEQDMLIGQRWRLVESEESEILFLGPDRRFGWDDLADLVNPLQHIPLISIAYRAMTGDQMYGAGHLLDMAFGPAAGATTVFQLAYESTTGENLEYDAVAAVFGPPSSAGETASFVEDDGQQVADLRNQRRGSNQ